MSSSDSSRFLTAWLGLWVVWLCVHVFPSPLFGFVLDDWSNVSTARAYPSLGALWSEAVWHPQRPVSCLISRTGFYLLGDAPAVFGVLSSVAWGALMGLMLWVGRALRGQLSDGVLAGLIFSAIPTMSEAINWPTMILSEALVSLPAYLVATAAFRKGLCGERVHAGWAAVCGGSFLVGLLAYEIGVFLPLAWAVWFPWKDWKRRLLGIAPLAGAGVFWLLWRVTKAFGKGADWALASHFSVDTEAHSLGTQIVTNAKDLVHWWVGRDMGGSFVRGWAGLGDHGGAVLLVFVAAGIAAFLVRSAVKMHTPSCPCRAFVFAVSWAWAGLLLSLVSYTASRLNVIPAMGLAWALAVMIPRRLLAGPKAVLFLLLLVPGWLANVGTTIQWSEAGAFCARAFGEVQTQYPEWEGKSYVVFDSRALVAASDADHPMTAVATYGNAGLFRGFVGLAWLDLAAGGKTKVNPIFDQEFGVELRDGFMHWHARYQPDTVNEPVAADRIFVVDLWEAGKPLPGQKD